MFSGFRNRLTPLNSANHIPRPTTWPVCAFSTNLLAGAIPTIADCSSLIELSNIADQLFYLIIGDLVFESRHLAALAIFYDPGQLRIRQLLHLRGVQIWHAHGPTDLGIAASIRSMARGTFGLIQPCAVVLGIEQGAQNEDPGR